MRGPMYNYTYPFTVVTIVINSITPTLCVESLRTVRSTTEKDGINSVTVTVVKLTLILSYSGESYADFFLEIL